MPVVSIFSGSYCHGDDIARRVAEDLGYRLIEDQAVVAEAGGRYGMEASKLQKALTGKTSIFNKFTHEKERSLACIKAAVADLLTQDNLVLNGFLGNMIERNVSHVLKVCIIADLKYRVTEAMRQEGCSEKEAIKRIHKEDESRVVWTELFFKNVDPWSVNLYDIVIPMDKTSVDAAVTLIVENVRKEVLSVTEQSRKAVEDFTLAAQVNLKLAEQGHNVGVSAVDGDVTITIDHHVLVLSPLEDELKRTASKVPGVHSVATRVGSGYYKSDVYRKFDFDVPLPSKVLLVDDEREFVQTLSERLQLRDVGSAAVYSGEEALDVVAEDEPEVMVLDLKMPGIDGLEVLKRVKTEHPGVEVIVLTGHGSSEVEKACLEMGACAYLEKPVDIDVLTQTMQAAYQKLRKKRESDREPG